MAVQQAPLRQRSVRYVKGVGPARAEQLARLGIRSVEDLVWYGPRRYEDRSRLHTIRQLAPGQVATVRSHVLAKSLRRLPGGRTLMQAAVGDATGVLECVWFNQPYLDKFLRVGEELIIHGRVEASGRRLQVIHPEIEHLDRAEDDEQEPADLGLNMGRLVPIYPLTEGLRQQWLRRIVKTALDDETLAAHEALPERLRQAHHLPSFAWAARQLHFPETWDDLEEAKRRLIFEELFLMQMVLASRRARFASRLKPQRYQPSGPLVEALRARLPFSLTVSQQQVIRELVGDLCQPHPMLRLLQGDVGCGKTVVAAMLMAVVAQSGYQAALMAPTELLAEQHARVLRGYFEPIGIAVRLISQGLTAKPRSTVLQDVASGKAQVVVGTHALIQGGVRFANLALVIIDEQHKFGVVQRKALVTKATLPDILVMTATPIPRTLALSLYGDLAVSTIAHLPPGRLPVRTVWYREAQRLQAYEDVRQQLRQGRQGYVVYPLIESGARQDLPSLALRQAGLRDATQMARALRAQIFPEYRVELLHGNMRAKDKDTIMRAFVEGQISLLVSTVIVEVGLDVPNATIMLIEHPERFGLAQLHQLRGRIGRSGFASTCLLISDTADELAAQRLQAFVETTDGFRLAERDLQLRGPGELLGRRQHGWMRFRLADLSRDAGLLELAREEATTEVAQRPGLMTPARS